MIVAGFGLRATASLPTLRALLGDVAVDALAIVADKADHQALMALAAQIRRPLLRVALADLATARAITPAPRQPQRYGPTSVAEAAALAAAGRDAILISPRVISPDGSATMALAETLAQGKTP